jgi:uncharacterized damage-inducible protein DinB
MEATEEIKKLLLKEISNRLFAEGFVRLRFCLSQINDKELWFKPNDYTNSIGNLVLHLIGNLSQWVLQAMGNRDFVRDRSIEFSMKEGFTCQDLLLKINRLEEELKIVIDSLTFQDLITERPVQIFEENGISILVHVTEHFSYHLGQITLIVKILKHIDTGYYKDLTL